MRLFTAIDLPADILTRLDRLIGALRPEAFINWSPLDNLHVTTKFIGEWPEARVEDLHHALVGLPARKPFEIDVKELGWFPHERSPRVLWIGVQAGEQLSELASQTEEQLLSLGIKKEDRKFSPHLTLARIKSPVPLARLRTRVHELQPAALGKFPVSHFSLFRSDAGSNASIYRKLREYKFESASGVA